MVRVDGTFVTQVTAGLNANNLTLTYVTIQYDDGTTYTLEASSSHGNNQGTIISEKGFNNSIARCTPLSPTDETNILTGFQLVTPDGDVSPLFGKSGLIAQPVQPKTIASETSLSKSETNALRLIGIKGRIGTTYPEISQIEFVWGQVYYFGV